MVCGSARARRSADRMPTRLEHTEATQGFISAAVASRHVTSSVDQHNSHGGTRVHLDGA